MKLMDIYLLTGYFLVASVLIIFFGRMRNTAEGKRTASIDMLILGVLIFLSYLQTRNEILLFVIRWAPLFFIFYFYKSAGILSRSFYSDTFDQRIISIEDKIFGNNNPCLWLSKKLDSYWLSEFLHLCYFSYFVLLYGVPLHFYLNHEYQLFYQFEFAELFVLLQSFLIHSVIPVLSPRTIFEKIPVYLRCGPIYRLVHHAVEKGSADGTAFPSTHVGMGTLVIFVSLYLHTPFFLTVLPFALGLVVSTVYGRFHYVTDLVGGIMMASLSFILIYH